MKNVKDNTRENIVTQINLTRNVQTRSPEEVAQCHNKMPYDEHQVSRPGCLLVVGYWRYISTKKDMVNTPSTHQLQMVSGKLCLTVFSSYQKQKLRKVHVELTLYITSFT